MICRLNRSRQNWVAKAVFAASVVAGQAVAHEENFDDKVRDYILKNPQVILEALERLSQEQEQSALSEKIASYPDLFDGNGALGMGPADAEVHVIEFFDYKCAPCKAVHPQLEALAAAQPNLRIDMRHLPILTPGSERASRFALATQMTLGDAAYRQVHEALWDVVGPLNGEVFKRIATRLDLDFELIETAMYDPQITAEIDRVRDVAIGLEILGTPAFLTKDSLKVGVADIDALAELWLNQ